MIFFIIFIAAIYVIIMVLMSNTKSPRSKRVERYSDPDFIRKMKRGKRLGNLYLELHASVTENAFSRIELSKKKRKAGDLNFAADLALDAVTIQEDFLSQPETIKLRNSIPYSFGRIPIIYQDAAIALEKANRYEEAISVVNLFLNENPNRKDF